MEHSFNTDIAQKYGVHEAVFIHNLYFWILKNECNGRHFYEGRNWTYNSLTALEQLFPYFTRKQIRTVISNCEAKGAVIRGRFNLNGYDKTNWFSLSEDVLDVYRGYAQTGTEPYAQNGTSYARKGTSCAQKGPTIPDSKPDNKTNIDHIVFEEIITYLNEKARTNYRSSSQKSRSLIAARLNDGYTAEDFKAVITKKCAEWNHEPLNGERDMRSYLRPETLFGTKFESYLNQKNGKQEPKERRYKEL